ncbi:MAG: peptide chain release factor-like protein [Candidatus Carsonella ruddii]
MYYNLIKNNYIKQLFLNLNINNEKDFLNNKIFFFFKNTKEKNMNLPCYIDVYQKAGGIETHDIINYIFKFYIKFFIKKKIIFKIIICEYSNFGLKKFLIFINELFSYYLFKKEHGIHRIIRKNPLSSNNKVQTSYIKIIIFPKFEKLKLLINKEDIIINYYKSKGSGGQHVNTTNSAVRIFHILSKITVTCQSERSQFQNKNYAIKILEYKLYLLKNFNNFFLNFSEKYIKTYNFEKNIVINHLINKKYNLNKYFNLEIDFIYDN